jgi:hypothetical protein
MTTETLEVTPEVEQRRAEARQQLAYARTWEAFVNGLAVPYSSADTLAAVPADADGLVAEALGPAEQQWQQGEAHARLDKLRRSAAELADQVEDAAREQAAAEAKCDELLAAGAGGEALAKASVKRAAVRARVADLRETLTKLREQALPRAEAEARDDLGRRLEDAAAGLRQRCGQERTALIDSVIEVISGALPQATTLRRVTELVTPERLTRRVAQTTV